MSTRSLLAASLCGIAALWSASVFGADYREMFWWPAADGSYDGNWNDSSRWSSSKSTWQPGDVPGAGDIATFPSPDVSYSVTIPAGDFEVAVLRVTSPQQDATKNSIRFCGSGAIAVKDGVSGISYGCNFASGTHVVIDGPALTLGSGLDVKIFGEFELRSGSLVWSSCFFFLTPESGYSPDHPYLLVTGGVMDGNRLKLAESPLAVYRQTGGRVKVKSFEVSTVDYAPVQRVELVGGVLHRNQDWQTAGAVFLRGTSTNIVDNLDMRKKTIPYRATYYGEMLAFGSVYYTYFDENSGHNGIIDYPHGITFGSVGDWSTTRTTYSRMYERLWFDTADIYDPDTKHRISYTYDILSNRGDFQVFGGGTLALYPVTTPVRMDSMTVGDGTTLDWCRRSTEVSKLRARNYRTENLTLGEGATVRGEVAYNTIEVSETPTVGEGASIVFEHHDGVSLTAGYPYFLAAAGVRDAAEALPVQVENLPSGWSLKRIANCTFAYDDTPLAKNTDAASEWCGGSDGYFSTAANWSKGVAPTTLTDGTTTVSFYTMQGDITNDVDNLWINKINNDSKKPNFPVRLSGKPIKLSGAGTQRGSAAAVFWQGAHPFIFNCDVESTSSTYFNVLAGNDAGSPASAYVAFLGKLDVPCTLDVSGHILIGSNAVVSAVWFDYSGSARTALVEVMRGASLTVTNQTVEMSRTDCPGRGYRVDEGGELAFTGGTGLYGNEATENTVNGVLSIGIPISAVTNMGFYGKGRLNIASVKSSSTAARVEVGERLRVYPGSWTTVTADGEGPITLALRTRATLGATNDWTYGVAPGVSTATAAADRALTVAPYETLTVDTEDPDTSAGHTITFSDPISAPNAFLEKKGCGTLVLESDANDLSTASVVVSGGTLFLKESQTVSSLVAEGGSEILFGADGDAVASLSVVGDVSLDGATISLTGDAKAAASMWKTVLTTQPGVQISGSPVAGDGLRLKVLSNVDGSQSLLARCPAGAVLIVR